MTRLKTAQNSNIIVIKIGTNVLTTPEGKLDLNNLRHLIDQISHEINHKKRKVVIITSGAIACGSEALEITAKAIPEKQAAASIGQILLMHDYLNFFRQKGITIGQILLTKDATQNPTLAANSLNTINTLLKNNVVPIINENDAIATDEIRNLRFGDNDELSYLVSKLIKAHLLIILTDIDGLFTDNPKKNPQAKLISRVEKVDEKIYKLIKDVANNRSRGGMLSKISYAQKASQDQIPVIIANGYRSNIIRDIFLGKKVGTYFRAQGKK